MISDDRGVYSENSERGYIVSGFAFQSEYPFIALGNTSDYGSTLFSSVEKNTPTKVKVTVNNIVMSSSIDWFAHLSAHVEDIEVL